MPEETKGTTEKASQAVTETPKESPEVAQLRSKLAVAEENWKNEQRVSAKKDAELQKTRDLRFEIDEIKEYLKVNAVELANLRGKTEQEFTEEVIARRPEVSEQFEKIGKEQERKRAEQKERERVEDFHRKMQELNQRTDSLGLDPESDTYTNIMLLTTTGNFELAEKRLAKLELVKKETEKPKMNEQDMEKEIEKRAEEKARKKMEEAGLLKTDTGTSAGATQHAKVSLSSIPVGSPEYRKLFPNAEDVFKGIREGWVEQ